jgi:hypothetical protein
MVLVSIPPNNCERAWWSFAGSGYVRIKARAHKKMMEIMVKEQAMLLHHHPGQYTKIPRNLLSSGDPTARVPSRFDARPITLCPAW